MGIFGKKKDDKKEQVTISNADPKDNPNTAVPQPEEAQKEPVAPAPETAEQVRERSAIKMLTTYYLDTQEIQVSNVQNLTRGMAEYLVNKLASGYRDENIANMVVMKLAHLVDTSKKNQNIWVPGQKR